MKLHWEITMSQKVSDAVGWKDVYVSVTNLVYQWMREE